MKILAIETSCDETAIAIVKVSSSPEKPVFTVLGNALYSQVKVHEQYGGVFPNLAKREHAHNLTPLLSKALTEAGLFQKEHHSITDKDRETLGGILSREHNLFESIIPFLENIAVPDIDYLAVTGGPGLEPALWVGINFAKALGEMWHKPIIPVNHMEGHVISSLLRDDGTLAPVAFPLLALLVSGGHTQLVRADSWLSYEIIGETRDDAIGEAFDKVARMLGLPYPGGPQISRYASAAREKKITPRYPLPRPMLHSGDLDFSFSGLKTAVLYTLRKIPEVTEEVREHIALEFENAVTDVIVAKVTTTLEESGAKTLVVGGGVSANAHLRSSLNNMMHKEFPSVTLLIPPLHLTTDNAVMIALAAYF